jgi:hypothetical protein
LLNKDSPNINSDSQNNKPTVVVSNGDNSVTDKNQDKNIEVISKNTLKPTIYNVVWFGLWYITTFNNISVTSWRSVIMVEETGDGVPGENHQPVTSH